LRIAGTAMIAGGLVFYASNYLSLIVGISISFNAWALAVEQFVYQAALLLFCS
jgi:hypothetical protein